MVINLSPETERLLGQEAARENKSVEQVTIDIMLAGIRNRQMPQSLEDLKPRRLLPVGKSFREAIDETPWPHDEPDLTDAEVADALEKLS